MRVLFGHQSVGQDILEGIAELARQGLAVPQVIDARAGLPSTAPIVLAHFRVGTNGQPLSKLADFLESAASSPAADVQVAMFKFCYVDLIRLEDAAPLFDAYVRTMDHVREIRPDLAIAHVTIPVRAVPPAVVGAAMKLMGREHPQWAQNAARHEFNERLRDRYGSTEPLFDLAAFESGGRVDTPALASRFTRDGGHLNGRGRRELARRFVEFLQGLSGGRHRGAAR